MKCGAQAKQINLDIMKSKLLYVNEHLTCRNYVSDHRCFFKFYSWNSGVNFLDFNEKANCLVFVVEGECIINCGQFLNRIIEKKELIFLPPHVIRSIITKKDCQVLICSFDSPFDVCIKSTLQEIKDLPSAKIKYDFSPTKIKDEMWSFVNLLIVLLKQKINCKHVHEIKQVEMFLLFKFFYTKEEMKWLFYEFGNKEQSFQNFVIEAAVAQGLSERILYGSDTYAVGAQRGRIEYAQIPEKDKKLILRQNAIRIFPELNTDK